MIPAKPLVIIESPFKTNATHTEGANVLYAKRCLLHSLYKGESPIASHLLYTQVLRDFDTDERNLGINAGLAWYKVCDKVVFYVDHGWSDGMLKARELVATMDIPCEARNLESF